MFRLNLIRNLSNNLRSGKQSAQTKPFKDVFGTLSETGSKTLSVHKAERDIPEDADGYDIESFDLAPRKSPYYYKYEITKHARQGSTGLRRALELFQTMKSIDRVTPSVETLLPLIYGCGKVGYTKRAFDLYEEYFKYYKKPSRSVVTCLLNACAESPFPEYGLERLNWFMKHLKFEHDITMNLIQYNCAIKAYAKLGKLEEASKLVEEMISHEIYPNIVTFNMLLMGCVANKEAGTTLALRLYKRLKQYGLKPNNSVYELMLRCIRDCGIGSQELINETLGELPAMTSFDQRLAYNKILKTQDKNSKWNEFAWTPLITDLAKSISKALDPKPQTNIISDKKFIGSEERRELSCRDPNVTDRIDGHQLVPKLDKTISLPNLLSDDHLQIVYKIKALHVDGIKTAEHRLMLFGGMYGFLSAMMKNDCKPDAKLFSLLLPCIGRSKENQLEYLRLSKEFTIKRDLLFYDLLLRNVCQNRHDRTKLDTAKQLIAEMHEDGLRPNISTFESLARGCYSFALAKTLVDDVEKCGFAVSNAMLKRLFDAALDRNDFYYLNNLIFWSIERQYKPPKELVEKLEEKRISGNEILVKCEKGILTEYDKPQWFIENHLRNFDFFKKSLMKWFNSVELLEEEHPWGQYYVEGGSKKNGYRDFVRTFEALNAAKEKALESGDSFDNLSVKAAELKKQAN